MHSSRELRSSSFEIEVGGRPARLEQLFEGFGVQDRLGVVMSRPCGAVGASALITATITAFYDLHAVSDRESAERGEPGLDPEAIASARGRIVTCLAYSPSGRVSGADVRIASNPVTEGYVEAILDPETRIAKLRAEAERDGAEADAAGASAASATEVGASAASASAAGAGAVRARIAAIEARIGEVQPGVRMGILRARGELVEDRVPVET